MLVVYASIGQSMTAEAYFDQASKEYVKQDKMVALRTLDAALQRFPGDPRLLKLAEALVKEDEQEQQQEQEQQGKEKQDQQQQEQEQQQEQKEQEEQQQQAGQEDPRLPAQRRQRHGARGLGARGELMNGSGGSAGRWIGDHGSS